MTALDYEQTITPERAPCTDCGILTAEDEINTEEFSLIGDWVCPDCGEERDQRRQERESLGA